MQSLKDQLNCSICLGEYEDPKGLPCLHSFCQKCLEIVPKSPDNTIQCPTCRSTVSFPPEGPSALPKAFHINTLLDLHKALNNAPVIQEGEVPLCPNHNKKREFYCQTDDEVICAVCAVRGHRQHVCDTTDIFYDQVKTEVETNLDQIKKEVLVLKDAVPLSDAMARRVREQGLEVKREINEIEETQERIKLEKDELIRSVDTLVDNKIRKIEDKKDTLNTMLAQFESCQEYIEGTLLRGTSDQLLFIHRQLVLHMKALIMHVDASAFERKESAIFFTNNNTELNSTECDASSCETSIGTICQIEFESCGVFGSKRFITQVGEPLSFTLQVKNVDGRGTILPTKHTTITCYPLIDQSAIVPCNITGDTLGMYTVWCVPSIPGPHYIQCMIGEVHVKGSPFTVRVIPTCELACTSEQLQFIKKLNIPSGVIVKEDKNMIVAERKFNIITVFNRQGERLTSFNTRHENESWFSPIGTLSGMALTKEGHLLAVDTSRNCILKFDADGGPFETIGTQGHGSLQFKLPYSIAVHPEDGRVFITDRGNSRIQVLNKDLTYATFFGNYGKKKGEFVTLFDIAIDSKGYLYVSDPLMSRIQKFDTDYQYMCSISITSPFYLCFDRQDILYVMEQRQPPGGILTFVFHVTHNHFVTIINCREEEMEKLGEFQWSKGCLDYGCTGRISLDREGFLYICDPCEGYVYIL